MAETIFVKSKFKAIIESKRLSNEDSNDLWADKEKSQNNIEYEYDYSDCLVDGETLSVDVNNVIEELINKGLKIISITPITSGQYEFYKAVGMIVAPVCGGYGYSYTEGVLITAI